MSDQFRLVRPWLLLGSARRGPVAHLPGKSTVPNKEGSIIVACGKKGHIIRIDGNPVVPQCEACAEGRKR